MYSMNDIMIIKDTILKEIIPYQIVLFGSYATGKQKDDSDIDLMILTKENISRKTKLNLLYRIEKRFLHLDYKVDLLLKNLDDFNEYKDYIGTLSYDVAKEGKVVWMKN